jgi:hypothetical protein
MHEANVCGPDGPQEAQTLAQTLFWVFPLKMILDAFNI